MEDEQPAIKLTLDNFLPYRLSLLSRKVSMRLSKVYADEFGLTIPEWRILAHLGERAPHSAKDIINSTLMDKSAVSRAVDAMAKKQLLEKERSEEDNRAFLLQLSDTGAAMYKEVCALALSWEQGLLESLAEDDLAQLFSLIDRLELKLR